MAAAPIDISRGRCNKPVEWWHGPSGERLGLWFRQPGYVPAASERLHQQHAGVHATAEDIDLVALVREGHGLRGDHLKVVVYSPPVAVSLNFHTRKSDNARPPAKPPKTG